MLDKIKSRINQGILYIFGKYDEKNSIVVKKILSDKEFQIFNSMSRYDKIHSFRLYNFVLKNEILKDDNIYLKLALLHDCGKESPNLLKRMKKVIFGDKKLEKHSEDGYIKLKNINYKLAILCKNHHIKSNDLKMQEFQKLDDK